MMDPLILVFSFGDVSSSEVIQNILKQMNQADIKSTFLFNSTLPTYMCDIQNKYFTNKIGFVSCEGNYTHIPPEILKSTEAIITYFETNNKSFLKILPHLNAIIKAKDIGLGILITKKLSEDLSGITYDEIKEKSHTVFDIVTLEESYNGDETIGCEYSDVVNALQSYVWSNIPLPTYNSVESEDTSTQNNAMENDLKTFENLFSAMQNIQRSSFASRDEFFDETEKLAEMLSTILDDDDYSDENN